MVKTKSSVVAKKPRDASCLSVAGLFTSAWLSVP